MNPLDPLPEVDRADELKRESIALIGASVPKNRFIHRDEQQNDKGVDLSFEALLAGKATRFCSIVQVKATDSRTLNADRSFSLSISTKNLSYLLNGPCPLYIVWLAAPNELRYTWARDEARRLMREKPEWRQQGEVVLRLTKVLDAAGWDDIHERIIREGRFQQEQQQCLMAAGAAEDVAMEINSETLAIRTPQKVYELIHSSGFGAVAAGYAKDIIRQAKLLANTHLSEPKIQLVLGYANCVLGHFYTARGHIGIATLGAKALSEIDNYLLESLRVTCDNQLGHVTREEWQAAQQRLEQKSPEFLARQIRLDRIRWSHLSAENDEERIAYFDEMQSLAAAIADDSKSTASMKLHSAIVCVYAELVQLASSWIHAVFAIHILQRTRQPALLPGKLAEFESVQVALGQAQDKADSLLQRAVENRHPIHYAEALNAKLYFHVAHTTNMILAGLSLRKHRLVLDEREFSTSLDEIQRLIALFKQADDSEGVVRASVMLANWYDINERQEDSIGVAREALAGALAMGYRRHVPSAEALIGGQSFYRQMVASIQSPADLTESWAMSTDDDIAANASIYAAVHSLPKDRIPNAVGSMKAMRRMCSEQLSWCRHFQLHEDLSSYRSVATLHVSESKWTGFCEHFRHRTRTELPTAEAVAKFKDLFCSTCDSRQPKQQKQ